MNLSIKISPLAELQRNLKGLPHAVISEVVVSVANYLVRVLANEEIPPQKYVSRRTAYPETGDGFFTDKQRRWFFWALSKGVIRTPYTRRGKAGGIASQWKFAQETDVENLSITNDAPGAPFVYDDFGQARQLHMVGWKTIGVILRDRSLKIRGVIDRATKRGIKKAGFEPL